MLVFGLFATNLFKTAITTQAVSQVMPEVPLNANKQCFSEAGRAKPDPVAIFSEAGRAKPDPVAIFSANVGHYMSYIVKLLFWNMLLYWLT